MNFLSQAEKILPKRKRRTKLLGRKEALSKKKLKGNRNMMDKLHRK